MCGIAGILDKSGRQSRQMGATLGRMLEALGRRGPDSAGAALYTPREDEALVARIKLGDHGDFDARASEIARRAGALAAIQEQAQDGAYLRLVLGYEGEPQTLQAAIEGVHPEVEVLSLGTALDIVKQVGSPQALERRFGLERTAATHAIAHTRLSTESKIDLSHSQPFWAHGSLDLATVHNGHITNYHKLRRQYEQRGVRFYTENDSEIIGLYLAELLATGLSLEAALRRSVSYFDGSFSYLAATATEIGYAKDRFGLKPLIVAETADTVAMATEEVALQAALGGGAKTWEPPAGSVRCWRVPGAASAARGERTGAKERAWPA